MAQVLRAEAHVLAAEIRAVRVLVDASRARARAVAMPRAFPGLGAVLPEGGPLALVPRSVEARRAAGSVEAAAPSVETPPKVRLPTRWPVETSRRCAVVGLAFSLPARRAAAVGLVQPL